MKKIKTTFEEAIKLFTKYYGKCPTDREITNLYHEYGKNWKHYDGFIDWVIDYTS